MATVPNVEILTESSYRVYHQNLYAEVLSQHVIQGCHWLDIGAGSRIHGGWLTKQESLASRPARLVGCDLLHNHLNENHFLTDRVACQADGLPFADRTFDIVSANMVLEHLTAPSFVFKEARRVLKPGGRFIFMTPHKGHPIIWLASVLLHATTRSWLARFEGRDPKHIFPTRYRANTPRRVIALAAEAGFEAERLVLFASHPFAKGWLGKVETMAGRLLGWRSNMLGVLRSI